MYIQDLPPAAALALMIISFSSSLNEYAPCFSAWISMGMDFDVKSGAERILSMSSAKAVVTSRR